MHWEAMPGKLTGEFKTAEPFEAPPPDPELRPSAATANYRRSFSIDASRGRCMRMQTTAQPADPTQATSGHPWLINKKPPKDVTSGGKRKAVFWGYAGLGQLGFSFMASQPMALGLSGFGGG